MGTNPTASDSVGTTLFGSVRGQVLGLLYRSPERDYYLREIVERLRSGHGAVQRELARLEACGLITKRRRGRQVFYQANQDAPVFPELRALLVKTTGIADVLRTALAPDADRIDVAFIFGSMAAGTDDEHSDIDVMIIGDLGLWDRSSSFLEVQLELGREVNPVFWPASRLREKLAEGQPFARNLLREPKVFIVGGEDELRRVAQQGAHVTGSGGEGRHRPADLASAASSGRRDG